MIRLYNLGVVINDPTSRQGSDSSTDSFNFNTKINKTYTACCDVSQGCPYPTDHGTVNVTDYCSKMRRAFQDHQKDFNCTDYVYWRKDLVDILWPAYKSCGIMSIIFTVSLAFTMIFAFFIACNKGNPSSSTRYRLESDSHIHVESLVAEEFQ